MSSKYVPSESKAEGSMTLRQFAEINSITYDRARSLYAQRRIIGATKLHNGRVVVFPPATIRESNYHW